MRPTATAVTRMLAPVPPIAARNRRYPAYGLRWGMSDSDRTELWPRVRRHGMDGVSGGGGEGGGVEESGEECPMLCGGPGSTGRTCHPSGVTCR